MSQPNQSPLVCPNCGEITDAEEYAPDTDQCRECHDAIPFDECGCPRCYDELDGPFRGLNEDDWREDR